MDFNYHSHLTTSRYYQSNLLHCTAQFPSILLASLSGASQLTYPYDGWHCDENNTEHDTTHIYQ